jgi:hypothetical protein
MKEIVRNVAEIEPTDRRALEHLLGQPLDDNEQLLLRVIGPDAQNVKSANGDREVDTEVLPEWCNIYEGLSDDEISAIEEIMLTRANLTRDIG